MLYVTTRNHLDSFTACPVLKENRAPDGGLFVPLHVPKLSRQDCARLAEMSFGQCAAEMLNLFFSTRLTGWDVDFAVGRYPVRLEALAHKIYLAEAWHNPQWQYLQLEKNLKQLVGSDAELPGNWVSVAIRMAVLAGILGHREALGSEPVDVSVVSGDFTLPISLWYLRKMGFPVGNIICCCNENNQFWDLLCNGQMRTDSICYATVVPEADITLPVNLERLIADCGGTAETERYLGCCRTGRTYSVSDILLRQLHEGLHPCVISSTRVETTIPNVFKTHNYILSPASALAYAGLLDYRAKTGITRTSIVVCDNSPLCHAETVAKTMDLPLAQFRKLIG